MLSTEQCIEILNHDILELFDGVILHCNTNTLEIVPRQLSVVLNESQKRLLVCLKTKVCTKRDIINIVWYENHQRISDNNYHQLTFQLRALFQRNNLPANLLITVPYYGLKLNESQWKILSKKQASSMAKEKNVEKETHTSNDDEMTKNTPMMNDDDHSGHSAVVAEPVSRSLFSPYSTHMSITQNAFILCMFVALVVFI